MRQAHAESAEAAWTPYWEYGSYIHVEDLARATVCALTCPDPGHEVPFGDGRGYLITRDEQSRGAEHVCPTFPGAEGMNTTPIPTVRWSTAGERSAFWAGNPSIGGTIRRSARLQPAPA